MRSAAFSANCVAKSRFLLTTCLPKTEILERLNIGFVPVTSSERLIEALKQECFRSTNRFYVADSNVGVGSD